MDLKTYAVHRKLRYDDDLLSYVVADLPIPISVVEASFQGFITPLEDKKSEQLIADFPELLANEVPVVVSKNQETGGYDVSGDIPDTLVDAITLVHNIMPNDVVAALVNHNLMTVHGQSCEILGTSLKEQVERTMISAMSIPDVVSVHDLMEKQAEKSETAESIVTAEPKTPESELPDMSSVLEDLDELQQMVEQMDTNANEDDLASSAIPDKLEPIEGEEPDLDTLPDLAEFDDLDAGELVSADEDSQALESDDVVDKSGNDSEPVMTEPADDMPVEDDFDMAAAIHRIYDKLCADIRAYNLDTRLNLAL